MPQRAPGRCDREGMSLDDLMRKFPTERSAFAWFVKARWPGGVACHYCGSVNVQTGAKHKTMPFRCRDCRKRFSVRTGTVMESSKLPLRKWAIAYYLMTTNIKGISSMKLRRAIGVTQRSAWFVGHRLREALAVTSPDKMAGPVEVDETYVGGKARNMHKRQRARLTGTGGADKAPVVGIRDRATGRVHAAAVEHADGPTLRGFIARHAVDGAKVYTDQSRVYAGVENRETVNHGAGEYVRGEVSVNGVEALWSMLKRGYVGTYHRMSPEHLARYVAEFAGRQNARDLSTADQMVGIVRGGEGKRIKFDDLTAHKHGQQATAI